MTKTVKEIMDIFSELSPENQHTFINYVRVARLAENSIKNPPTQTQASSKAKRKIP